MRRVMKAFLLATAGTAATGATAQAATLALTPAKACYLTGETVTLSGAGFTPGAPVNVADDGAAVGSATADAAGNVSGPYRFGLLKAVKSHTLTGTDGTNTASLAYTGTTHQVATRSDRGKPGKKTKLRGYGFLFGPKAYMHVRGHGIKRNTFLARPKAPCGTFIVRKAFVPSNAPTGKYRVQFDARKKYSKKTPNALVYELTVFRTFSSAAFAPSWALTPAGG